MQRRVFAGIVPGELLFDEFVTIDDELPTESEHFELNTAAVGEDSEEEGEEDAEEETPQVPTAREATQMCSQLQLYLCAQDADENELKALDSVLAFVEQKQSERRKQTALTQFFTRVP